MAFTSAMMGLRVWNLLTDLYDHVQLADNWAKVDYHDHSPGKGVQIPTEGIADGAVTGAKLTTLLDPTAAYTAIKSVATAGGFSPTAAGAFQYILKTIPDSSAVTTVPVTARVGWIYFNPAWWTAPGRTVTLQLHARILTNAVAPGATYEFAFHPITAFGGASGAEPIVNTVGAAVTGSTATITNPGAAVVTTATATFAAPAEGQYVLAVTQTGAGAAGSIVTYNVNLGVKSV